MAAISDRPEPHLHYFLRMFSARLTDKAHFYLHATLEALLPTTAAGLPTRHSSNAMASHGVGALSGSSEHSAAACDNILDSSSGDHSMESTVGTLPSAVPVASTHGASPSEAYLVDYAALVESFVSKSGALLVAAVFKPDGLNQVKDGGNGSACCYYTRRAEEVPLHEASSTSPPTTSPILSRPPDTAATSLSTIASSNANTSATSAASAAASATTSAKEPSEWPALFLSPRSANARTLLRAVWPTVMGLREERQALLRGQLPVHASLPVKELNEAEHTFWLLHTDERVLILVVFGGRKRQNDANVSSFLQALSGGLNPDKLVESSLRESQQASAGAPVQCAVM